MLLRALEECEVEPLPRKEKSHETTLTFDMTLVGYPLRFVSTVTKVAAPKDITMEELEIETFYPADAETEAILRSFAQRD